MAMYHNIPDNVTYGQGLMNQKLQFQLQNRNVLHFFPGEYLIFHALNSMDSEADPIENCWLITNMRFTKLEKGRSVTDIPLASIQRVRHQKNGLFKWDKVEFFLKNGSSDTAGLASSKQCAWVVQQLTKMLAGNVPPQWGGGMQPVQPVQPVQPIRQPQQPIQRPIPQQPIQQPLPQQPIRQPLNQPGNGIGGVPVLLPGNTVFITNYGTQNRVRVNEQGIVDASGVPDFRSKWVVFRGQQADTFSLQSPATGGFLRITAQGVCDANGILNGPQTQFRIAPSNHAGYVGLQVTANNYRLGFTPLGSHKAPVNVGMGPHGSFSFMLAQ